MIFSSAMNRTHRLAALVLAVGLTACQRDEECRDFTGAVGAASWGQCGDRRDRRVKCESVFKKVEGRIVECSCSVGDMEGAFFSPKGPLPTELATVDSATKLANEQCGWHLSR